MKNALPLVIALSALLVSPYAAARDRSHDDYDGDRGPTGWYEPPPPHYGYPPATRRGGTTMYDAQDMEDRRRIAEPEYQERQRQQRSRSGIRTPFGMIYLDPD